MTNIPKHIAIGESLKFGWRTMKGAIGFFIGIIVLTMVLYIVPGWIIEATQDLALARTAIQILAWIISVIIGMGYIKISLAFADNKRPTPGDLFAPYPLFWKYLGGSILYGLIVAGGFLLLIIPGIVWALKYQFYGYAIVDKQQGPVEALRTSSELTNGVKWELLAFNIVRTIVNYLGLLALGIGLFATIPTTLIARAYIYRRLEEQTMQPVPQEIGSSQGTAVQPQAGTDTE